MSGARFAVGWLLVLGLMGAAPSFAQSDSARLRDPFWPVGYAPPTPEQMAKASAPVVVVEEKLPDVQWPALPVRGRSKAPDGTYRVLIEGVGIVGENKVVAIRRDDYRFLWRIVRIDERGVQSKRLGFSKVKPSTKSTVAAPARRKEKKP